MMKCESPYYDDNQGLYFPCGKCVRCRMIRKMEWVTRMSLEKQDYGAENMAFVTLTYDDENLVYGGTDVPTLVKQDLQLYIKRIRRQLEYHHGIRIRYFACGEYGTGGNRVLNPHYHLIIYGVSPAFEQLLTSCWSYGYVTVLPVTKGGIEYCSGYCVKKVNNLLKCYEEYQVLPEFFLSSQGLGRSIIEEVVDVVKEQKLLDVPRFVMKGAKKYFLTRYWLKKIREICYNADYIAKLKEAYMQIVKENFETDVKNSKSYNVNTHYMLMRLSPHREERRIHAFLLYHLLYFDIIREQLKKYAYHLTNRNRIQGVYEYAKTRQI